MTPASIASAAVPFAIAFAALGALAMYAWTWADGNAIARAILDDRDRWKAAAERLADECAALDAYASDTNGMGASPMTAREWARWALAGGE